MPRRRRDNSIIEFMEKLTVPSGIGAGGSLRLLPFQRSFLRDIYQNTDAAGRRKTRRAILSMGRKNGKSLLTAGIALAHLVGPLREPNGEIYSAANDTQQARIVFNYAKQMAKAEPEIMRILKISDSTQTMVNVLNGTIYRALSGTAYTKYGLNPTVVIYDELAQAKGRELFDALDTSMAAREEPLMIIISTQANDASHILSELIDYARNKNDETTMCHLYAVPDDTDQERLYSDPQIWKLANPALGKIRSLEEMRDMARRAYVMPSYDSVFRNLYLNMRVSQDRVLLSAKLWDDMAREYDEAETYGHDIWMGLDLSMVSDLSAIVGITDEGKIIARFYMPSDTILEHEKRDKIPYTAWARRGYIRPTPGKTIDYRYIVQDIQDLRDKYTLRGVAYDRWNMKYFSQVCLDMGLEITITERDSYGTTMTRGICMVPWGQTPRDMSPAIDALERAVLLGQLCHNNNPVLSWNVSNAVVVTRQDGSRMLDKSIDRKRIDGAVALCMAAGLRGISTQALERSVYNERGLITL